MTTRSHTVRRSVAIPSALVEEALDVAPASAKQNFNRLVRFALQEFVAKKKEEAFAAEMARMARDPQIQKENRRINRDFAATEMDGLDR